MPIWVLLVALCHDWVTTLQAQLSQDPEGSLSSLITTAATA